MTNAESISAAMAAINSDLKVRGNDGLYEEQRAVLQDRYSADEAIGMLDDLRDRVGGISDATWTLAVSAVIENTQLSRDQRTFVDARIMQAIGEIALHLTEQRPFYPGGPVPRAAQIRSFSDLHSYCDANELGGLCDQDVSMDAERLFPERTDAETLHSQGWMAIANQIQNAVGEWLVSPPRRRARVATVQPDGPSAGFAMPVGWWVLQDAAGDDLVFERGLYLLRVREGSIRQFALELRDEQGRIVTTTFQTTDWLRMQACLLTLPPSPDYLAMQRGQWPSWGDA